MRPIHVVLDQIRWDPRLDPARFAVVWDDRVQGEQTEPVTSWLARGDVPQHRIRRLLHEGRVVWDRQGVDQVDGVADVRSSAEPVGAVAVWNVLDDAGAAARADAIADQVVGLAAGIVGLIEVGDPVAAAIAARLDPDRVLERRGSLALVLPRDRAWSVTLLPLPGRDALLASAGDLAIAVAHLTSDFHGDRAGRREEQLAALAAALPRHGALVVLVDANTEQDLPPLTDLGLVDPGSEPTFDPLRNPLVVARPELRRPRRLDRVLVRGVTARFTEVVRPDPPLSDHFALVAALGPPARSDRWGRSAETAVVVVPPPGVAAVLDAVRRGRDDAVDRWPAHLTVTFPFVAPAALDEAEVELARALVGVEPFPLALDRVGSFEQPRTWWAGPADDSGLQRLARAVDRVVPHLAPPGRTFHLTLSRGPEPDPVACEFPVDRVAILRRGGTRYEVAAWVPLGRGTLADAVAETGLLDDPARWVAAADAVRTALAGVVTVVGGAAHGVRLVGGDLDLVWEPPQGPDPLGTAMEALAAFSPARVDAVAAPRLKLRVDGLDVDLVLGGHDAVEAAADAVPTLAVAAMKIWARRRGLTGAGMPASVAWRRLLAAESSEAAEDRVVAVVGRLSRSADLAAVSGAPFRSVDPGSLARVRAEAARGVALVDGADPAWRAWLAPRP